MANINLLPWRQQRRELLKKKFIALCMATAVLGLLLAGLTWSYFKKQLIDQNAANDTITSENQRLASQLKSLDGLQVRRDEILQRMKLIQELQGVRPVIVHVFDEITRLTPANMYLTGFSREGDKFSITGKAQDPNVVSDFLRNLGGSPWFRNAFMNSFVAAEAKPVQQGAVIPRPEDNYGTFLVTVDLANTGTLTTTAQPAPGMPQPSGVPTPVQSAPVAQ